MFCLVLSDGSVHIYASYRLRNGDSGAASGELAATNSSKTLGDETLTCDDFINTKFY